MTLNNDIPTTSAKAKPKKRAGKGYYVRKFVGGPLDNREEHIPFKRGALVRHRIDKSEWKAVGVTPNKHRYNGLETDFKRISHPYVLFEPPTKAEQGAVYLYQYDK